MKNAKELNKMTENAMAEKQAFYQQMATSKELFEKLEKCMEESAKSGSHSIVLEYFFQDYINFKWPPDKTKEGTDGSCFYPPAKLPNYFSLVFSQDANLRIPHLQ